MEGKGVASTGVTVVEPDAPTDYQIAPRTDPNPVNSAGGSKAVPAGLVASEALRKKRGRPRKYGPDGALNARPISAIAPSAPSAVIDFSAEKRPKMRPATSPVIKPHHPKFGPENLGAWASCSVGANFTPHIIAVHAGEDVTMKIISFSQQGPRAVCILSANGAISYVTVRQSDSSGGTVTYEGRFEIVSLTGSFTPSESGGIRNRSGGMSISLASPDGRIVGGSVAGLLVAASPIQIVVGSFLSGNQHEHEEKPKEKNSDYIPNASPSSAVPSSCKGRMQGNYGGQGHHASGGSNSSAGNISSERTLSYQ